MLERWGLLQGRLLLALLCLPVCPASGADEPVLPDAFPQWATHWRLAEVNPVFAGAGGDAWDAKIRERGWIVQDDDAWLLYYTGYNESHSPLRRLGLATSRDGRTWTRDACNPLVADAWVEDMCVVRDGDRWLMFAEGQQDIAHLLTSHDGRTWVRRGSLDVRLRDGQPISPGPRGTPTVFVDSGTWVLFYERGDQGVWLARSDDPDRLVWTNMQDAPVIARGPEPYDATAVALNQVVKRDGVFYAFYHANAHRPWRDWTTCVARSRDLIHWEKYAGNPIVANNCSSGIVVDPDGEAGPEPPLLFTMHPEVRLHEPAAPLRDLRKPNPK